MCLSQCKISSHTINNPRILLTPIISCIDFCCCLFDAQSGEEAGYNYTELNKNAADLMTFNF